LDPAGFLFGRRSLSVRVGVFGATGYTGRELVRLLRRHPRASVAFTTGSGGGHLAHEQGLEQAADAYMLALPHGISATYAARLREARPQALVVDLSGDLRLPTAEAYKTWYGHEHPAPQLVGQAVFGLSEVYRDRLSGARLVSNPGCYATSVLLPLVPLLREAAIDAGDIVADAKSGATGAGRSLREDLLFCELAEDFSAYSPGRSHRHVGEIEAVLRDQTGQAVELTFCPHLLPVKRGILTALYVKPTRELADLRRVLESAYAGSAFVHVVDAPPRLSDVVETNDCRISVHAAASGRAVVFSALDNLVKGAAGQAIQNLNLALGFEEAAGLASAFEVPAGSAASLAKKTGAGT
jgi:N-acetyl-gamma-glutamyl-phosphate reductase